MVRFFKNPYEDMIRKNQPRPATLPQNYQEWDKIEIEVYLSNIPSNFEYVDKTWPPKLLGKCIGIAYADKVEFRGIYSCVSEITKVIIPDMELEAVYFDNNDEEFSDSIEVPSQTITIEERGNWEEGKVNPSLIEVEYDVKEEVYEFQTMDWQGTY